MVLYVADCQYSPARLNFSDTIIVRPVRPNDDQEPQFQRGGISQNFSISFMRNRYNNFKIMFEGF
jgi:hypothetical protein